MTAAEARDILARCKRERDVWRIAGLPPSLDAVARVERDEAAAREALAAEHAPRPVTPSERDGARAVAEARDVLHVATPGSVAHRTASHVVAAHAVRVAAERERDALRSLLATAARGELPRCDDCGTRLATLRWSDTGDHMCDECLRALRREFADAGEAHDEAACETLPHAAALRAAMGGAS